MEQRRYEFALGRLTSRGATFKMGKVGEGGGSREQSQRFGASATRPTRKLQNIFRASYVCTWFAAEYSSCCRGSGVMPRMKGNSNVEQIRRCHYISIGDKDLPLLWHRRCHAVALAGRVLLQDSSMLPRCTAAVSILRYQRGQLFSSRTDCTLIDVKNIPA